MISASDNNPSDSLPEQTAGFFAHGGVLDKACAATAFPFEIRPQQQKMAEAVVQALVDTEHLAVEAGTGVGKTFAYLVPLILYAVHSENRVAVSTYTINLQEQLMFKDVPFLLENMGLDFRVALCKGRHNYICLRRLEGTSAMSGDLFNKNREKELARVIRWADKTRDGSLADFADSAQPSRDVWQQVCSEHDNCLGKKCKHYLRCFLMKARNAAFDADLLILNHHLFFSDLALRRDGSGILPDIGSIVIDEAHCLEEIASEHLGLRLSQGGIYHWLRRLYIPASGKGLLAALHEHELAEDTGRVWENVAHFFAEIGLLANLNSAESGKRLIEQKPDIKTMLVEQIAHLVHGIEKLRDATEQDELKTELNAVRRRGDEIRSSLDFFLKQPEPNHVYWVEQDAGRRIALVSAPIEVSSLLKDLLFKPFSPVVMTSATLSVNNSLSFFRARVGAGNCRELILDSPFDYQCRMKVLIGADMPEPNGENFPETVINAVARFVVKSRGRAFVLFTNANLMRQVADGLRSFLEENGFLFLVQGEGLPRHVMLKAFRQANGQPERQISERQRSEVSQDRHLQSPAGPPVAGKAVLFGLDSFWMGVDVPGEALSNVIIVRLPFAVPDEPLIKARVDLLAAQGKDAFREYSLPQAILKFRQGVGRLIRTATDEGTIAVLDSRIVSRWYGRFFLQSIPECPVELVRLNEDVDAFE